MTVTVTRLIRRENRTGGRLISTVGRLAVLKCRPPAWDNGRTPGEPAKDSGFRQSVPPVRPSVRFPPDAPDRPAPDRHP